MVTLDTGFIKFLFLNNCEVSQMINSCRTTARLAVFLCARKEAKKNMNKIIIKHVAERVLVLPLSA